MESPVAAFDKLNPKARMAVIGGSVGLAGLLWYRSKHAPATDASTVDATGTVADTGTAGDYATDEGAGAFVDNPYYGGGFGSANGVGGTTANTPTSTSDGTTPEAPAQTAPVIINVGATTDPTGDPAGTGLTGGGAPATPHPSDAHMPPAFKTIQRYNNKTKTVQLVHDYAGTNHDVVVSSTKVPASGGAGTKPKSSKPARGSTKKKH